MRVGILVALVSVLVGCRSPVSFDTADDFEFRMAEDEDSIAAYQKYLAEHPRNREVPRAHVRIHELWTTAYDRSAGWQEAALMKALLDHLKRTNDVRVAVEVQPPEASALEAVDQMVAGQAVGGRPIAPVAKHFAKLSAYTLSQALSDELQKALGAKVVAFRHDALEEGRPLVHVTSALRASDSLFSSPNGERVYLGVIMDFRIIVRVPGRPAPLELTATVEPEEEFTFSSSPFTMSIGHPEWDSMDDEVYGGMAKSAFRRLGIEMVARLSGQAAPPPKQTPEIERLTAQCEKDEDRHACAALARRYIDGDGVPVDKKKAVELLDEPCFWRVRGACVMAAKLLAAGDGVPKDLDKAFGYLYQGCDRYEAEACLLYALSSLDDAEAGDFARPGKDRQGSHEYAFVLLLKACDLGDAHACAKAGGLWDGGGLGTDTSRAAALLGRACAGGEEAVCTRARALDKQKPTGDAFGMPLAEDMRIYDVRYDTPYEGGGQPVLWVASPSDRDAFAPHEKVTIRTWAVDDLERPPTAPPPPGTKTVARVAPVFERGTLCPPCKRGVEPPMSCECLPQP